MYHTLHFKKLQKKLMIELVRYLTLIITIIHHNIISHLVKLTFIFLTEKKKKY